MQVFYGPDALLVRSGAEHSRELTALCICTLLLKNQTHVTFSNNFNKCWLISIIFSTQNLQRVFILQVSNRRVLIKMGTSLLYFHSSHLQQLTLIKEMCLRKENRELFSKLSVEGFGANRLMKEFTTKG